VRKKWEQLGFEAVVGWYVFGVISESSSSSSSSVANGGLPGCKRVERRGQSAKDSPVTASRKTAEDDDDEDEED